MQPSNMAYRPIKVILIVLTPIRNEKYHILIMKGKECNYDMYHLLIFICQNIMIHNFIREHEKTMLQ